MARIRPQVNPNAEIPNNPFYAPLNPYVCGPYFPVAMGSGIDLSSGATVPTLVNDVSTVLSAGSGIALTTFLGVTTITATGGGGGGGVTSVTGTAPITVNNTNPLTPIVGVNAASTTASGVVQLSASTVSTSNTTAATSSAVRAVYDVALAAMPKAGGTFTGNVNFFAGTQVGTILSVSGFTPGSGYTPGTYAPVNLLGGTGTGATARVTVDVTGAVTNVTLLAGGSGYSDLDILNPNLPTSGGLSLITLDPVASSVTPGVGILDCTGLIGSAGQVLSSTGTTLEWISSSGSAATPTTTGTVLGYTDGTDTDFNTALGYCALGVGAGAGAGFANVAIGICAGCAMGAGGYGNTLVGPGTGIAVDTGGLNTALGIGALSLATSGTANVVVGMCSGCAYTTESGNAVFGGYYGDPGDSNSLILADGTGNLKAKFNGNGALSFDGTDYGTPGQVLQSAGPTASPTWLAGATGSFTTVDGKTVVVINGVIASII